jgi:hypothetical protein
VKGASLSTSAIGSNSGPVDTEPLLPRFSAVQLARSLGVGNGRASYSALGDFICARDTRTRVKVRLDGARLYHTGSSLHLAVNDSLSGVRSSVSASVCRSCCVLTSHFASATHTYDLTIVTTTCVIAAMQLNYLASVQGLARTKTQFALFFVAFFSAKLMHLGSHAGSLPIILYVLYTPTFLLPDVLLLLGSKVLVYRLHGGQSSAIRKFFGGVLA